MNPEVFQLAAEHGTRSGPLFWGWDVALEMFFGGIAGALMLFSGVTRFDPRLQRTLNRIARTCLLVAGALLFLDAGAKLHVVQFFLSWRPTSVLFWGTWILTLAVAASIFRLRPVASAAGIALMLYPGLLLASMTVRTAWSGPWLPIEFFALSLGSGAAVIMLVDPRFSNRTFWARPVAVCVLGAVFVARAAVLFAGQR